MTYVRSRKFCCCLPVRLGVLIIGILGLVGGTVIAMACVIYARHTQRNPPYLILQIAIYSLLAILSLFGLIGAIAKRRRLVSLYFFMLTAHFTFSLSSGAYSLYRLFRDAPTLTKQCINGSSDKSVIKDCEEGMTLTKWLMVALLVIIWLIEIWGCIIVNNYSKQLAEEEAARSKAKDSEAYRPRW